MFGSVAFWLSSVSSNMLAVPVKKKCLSGLTREMYCSSSVVRSRDEERHDVISRDNLTGGSESTLTDLQAAKSY